MSVSRTRVAGVSVIVALSLSGALSGCSTAATPGAAAVVNGEAISVDDVQVATRQLSTGMAQPQQVNPAQVVTGLIYSKLVLPQSRTSGKAVSDDQAKALLPKLSSPAQPTLDFLKTALVLRQLDQKAQEQTVQEIKDATINLNPRYGTFDASAIDAGKDPVTAAVGNWLKVAKS